MFFVGYVDPFSEVRLAVLGFFLNFARRRRRRNGQILDLLGFAAGKKMSGDWGDRFVFPGAILLNQPADSEKMVFA